MTADRATVPDLPADCCAAAVGAEVIAAMREHRQPSATVLRAHTRAAHPEAWAAEMGTAASEGEAGP